ncbi:alpha/beta hydrolase [Enterococcus sp. 2201sp1_2201st1_B8_2201SCRN_220225]|uniref:alpha/beta hydrolase n=1 Tax=unclassified Enterococcus TaxID=2608891 RepID=UPI0034A29CF2
MNVFTHEITAHNGESGLITAYLPEYFAEFGKQDLRKAVVICPGGGYVNVSAREGEPVALQLVAAGIPTFVLTYSVAPAKFPTALTQLAETMLYVRENATSWHIDPEKILVAGFSAGGHLAASLGTMWQSRLVELGYDSDTIQPNGLILGYPVISSGEFAHKGSFENLLGKTSAEWATHSLETLVTNQVPPVFIWHTVTDAAVPVENTLAFVQALQQKHVSYECHLYPNGPHGLSLANETTATENNPSVPNVQSWLSLLLTWLETFF